MRTQVPQKLDGIYRSSVSLIANTWKNHPFRIPILMIVFLLSLTVSAGILVPPQSPLNQNPEKAKANTNQFAPTGGQLVSGTEQNANSVLAATNEGVNTGSWKGTIGDDNFHWQVSMLDAGTDRLNMQLSFGTAKLSSANKLMIQTEFDADIATRLVTVQICDWVSSTSVDAAADSQCTTGGWRSLNSQNASNADVTFAITAAATVQWHIYDGYFTTGTTGGTAVSTPLTNFTASDTQPVKIRYFSQSAITGSGDFAVDYARLIAIVDSVYHPAGFTNLGSGTPAGTYANAQVVGNSSTAQQSVTAGNAVYLAVPGTAGSIADFYVTFKGIKTYTGMNTLYVKADYSCSSNAGPNYKPAIYNFNSSAWEDLTTTTIACSTTDATNAWAKNNVTITNYLSTQADGGDVRIRWYGVSNATQSIRLDFIYLIAGTTNTDSANCAVTFGSGTATNCTKTRDLDGTTTPTTGTSFQNAAEDESNTFGHAYFAKDNDGDATVEEASAANIGFVVTPPSDAQLAAIHFASRHSGCGATNSLSVACGATAMTVQPGLKDYSGRASATGGWTQFGSANGSTALTSGTGYSDSVTALSITAYGVISMPDAYLQTTTNEMNVRLATTASGTSTTNVTANWDFALVSIAWYPDSQHPSRLHEYNATSGTLATGTTGTILSATAAAAGGVNTGGYQGTLADDNYHWTVNGANVVGTNHDVQLNFDNVELYGANKLFLQTAFDTDAAITAVVQICDWVSTTNVDTAADANCTGGGWRTINSQNASNADVTIGSLTNDTSFSWQIYDGYFTTGTTGGTAISTPIYNFIKNDSTKRIKIRYFNTTQTATAIDIDFARFLVSIDSFYNPAGFTNLGSGTPTGTYATTVPFGNTASAQLAMTADTSNLYLAVPGTAGTIADFYLSFRGVKTYAGMNSIYLKAEYSCSAATGGLSQKPAVYNFSTASWEDLTTSAMACSTTDAQNGWAKNSVTIANYISGGEVRIRWYGTANSTTSLRLDVAYIIVGSVNSDTAQCEISFGSGTSTNCSNTRTLDGTAAASYFENPAEDESTTMGTGESNSYYALDNESTPDTTAEEASSANIKFPVTLPSYSSATGLHYVFRYAGCGVVGSACGATAMATQPGIRDLSAMSTSGSWPTFGGSTSSTVTLIDSVTNYATTAAANGYGIIVNPEDFIDTSNNIVQARLSTAIAGTAASNTTAVWDFAMISMQWIEIGATIDISGSSSVTGQTVAVAVNGILQSGKTTTTTGTCPCSWTISAVWVGNGRPVVVWHDTASDANESSGVTAYDGSGNITGMQLTAHTLSLGSADDQTVDFTELILYDNDDDEDIMYKTNGATFDVDATATYSDEILDVLSGDTLSVGGSETVNTHSLSINGTLTSGGASTYNVDGAWTNAGVFNESTSTVNLTGTTSQNLNSGCSNTDTCTDQNFYNLTINKTDANTANDNITLTTNGIRVTNTLTITDGELVQGTLNVRVEGSSAVSVTSNGTWTNISTGDLKLGGTFVNNGTVILNSNNGTQCVDAADDIAITSTSGGSQRTWSGSGTETIYNVNVTDMTDSTVTAYTSTFNNTTWTAGTCGISISGTCDQYDRTTDCTDDGSNQIRVAVNGSLQAQVDSVVDGSWSITGVSTPSSGDLITVFIDANADNNEAVAVVNYDGTGDISGVLLYQRHLTLGSDDNTTLTNIGMSSYDNSVSADEDIFFDIDASNDLTVDAVGTYTDEYLYVKTGNTYRPHFLSSGFVNTTNLENDGTIQSDANAFTINGNWQNDGTFTANTSTVTFNSTTTGRTLSGTMTGTTGKFYNLTFNGAAGAWTFNAAVEASNDFQVSNGAVTASNNNLTVGRDFILDNTAGVSYTPGSSTIAITRHFTVTGATQFAEDTSTVQMTGTGTITYGNGGDFYNLSIGYTSFTTTASANNYDIYGTVTFNGGSVAGGGSYWTLRRSTTGSSVTFASATTITGSNGLYHLAESGTPTFTITGGNYGSWDIIPYSAVNSATYTLGGNVTTTGFFRFEANDSLTGNSFNTSGSNYSISASYIHIAPCAPTRTGSWALDFNDSTVTLSSTTTALFVGSNCGSHTLDLDTSAVTVNGSVSFVNGTTSLAITPGTSDFTFAPAASQTETYASNGQSLWNMIISGANSAATIQPTSAVDVNNNFTISAGTYDTVSGSNWGLTIGGNYSNSATFTARNGTVTFDATDTGNTIQGTLSGSSAFYNLTFNGSGGEWTPNAAVAVTNDLTMTAGTLLGTQNVTVNANVQGTNGIINLTGGTFEQRSNNTSRNFGTTSSSAAWTFNDLTFSDSCTGACTFGNITYTTQTGGTGGITVAGILRVSKSGDQEGADLNAGNRTWTLSGTGGDPFQVIASPAGDLVPATSTFTYTGNNGAGNTTVQSETYNNLIVNNGSETYDLEGTTSGVDITVTAGTLALNSQTLTATDDLTVDGTLSGNTNVTASGHVQGTGTINLTGGTFKQSLLTGGLSKNFGTTSGSTSWTFNDLTFANDCTICVGATVTTQTGGSGGVTVTGILRVGESGDGHGMTLNAGNRTWTLSGTGGDPFQILASPAGDLTPSTSTFSYTGNNAGGATTVQSETYNNLTVNNGSETYNLEGNTIAVATTITAGTLALNGFTLQSTGDLTVNGTLSGNTNVTANAEVTGSGTITLTGGIFLQRIVTNNNYGFGSSSGSNDWTFNSLTIRNSDTNDHTVTTRATGSGQIVVSATLSIGSGTDSNNLTLDNNTNDRILNVDGSVDITTRGVLQASSSASFTVGDNWTNSGTFTHNSGTVTFDTTTAATFTGATTFYNFTSTTAAKTLEFTSGQTFTIDAGGLLTLTGAADPNEIQIKSTTPTSQWFINHQGTESVSYVQVIDSGCDGASTQISTSNSVNDGNNGTCWLFGSTYEQADYRFGEEPEDASTDSDYTGMPAENTAYSTSGTGDVFRLRMLLHIGGSNLAINGETFKLQYGEKTAATCTSGVSWGDVSTSSGVIRYYDGAPTDGDNITSVVGDPDHSGHTKQYQDYEESNNFTNSVSAINSGQDGVWAFSLVNNSAVGGKRYCFKAVKSTGSDLDTYTFYPEVIIDEELIFSLDSTSKTFGVVTPGANPTDVSSTLTTTTNSSTGYVIYAWSTQVMTMGSFTISDWLGTNSSPTTFGNGSFGFGYTTNDSSLTGGTADRFTNGGAKYAGFTHVGPGQPVADRTSGPVTGATDTVTYRLAANGSQAAGTYSTVVVYVCSVTF